MTEHTSVTTGQTVTVTLSPGPGLDRLYYALKASFARARGWHDLAAVIERQEGAQIVRDGMGDVLHWLKECACYDRTDERLRCDYITARQREAFESLAAATNQAMATIQRAWTAMTESLAPQLRAFSEVMDRASEPPSRPTGRAAQRSPYGPQGGRR